MMTLEILTPEWRREVADVEAVFLPGTMGSFEVLRNHAPLLSTLAAGDIRWRLASGEESLAVRGGAVRVSDNLIQVCAEI